MKPSVETGLASHSSIMVAPREFARGCEDGEGWIKVSSKKTLRKNKGIHKKKTYAVEPVVAYKFV